MHFAKSRQTPSCQVQRRGARRIARALVLVAIIPLPAHPEPSQVTPSPDRADLRTYLECAAASNERLLGFDEAAFCSTIFMKIKLAFIPNVDLEKYSKLPSLEKSAVDRLGYLRYLDWKQRNAAEVDALMTEIRASQMGG